MTSRLIIIAAVLAVAAGVTWLIVFAEPPAVYKDKTARQWARQLNSNDAGTRVAACDALGAMGANGAPGVSALMRILQVDRDARVRSRAAEAMGKIGRPAAGELAGGLAARDPITREHCAWALGLMAGAGADAVDALLAALSDDSAKVRYRAAWALLQMKRAALTERSVAKLAGALTNETATVRRTAAAALATFGPDAVAALPALIAAFEDKAESVRTAAARTVKAVGPTALPGLIEALQGPKDKAPTRVKAAECIIAAGAEAALAPTEAMLRRCAPEHRPFAMVVLLGFGRESVPAFIRVLDHEDPAVCEMAARTLQDRYGAGALPPLIGALNDPNAQRSQWAERIIERIGLEAVPALKGARADPERKAKATALLEKITKPRTGK